MSPQLKLDFILCFTASLAVYFEISSDISRALFLSNSSKKSFFFPKINHSVQTKQIFISNYKKSLINAMENQRLSVLVKRTLYKLYKKILY